MSISKIVIMGNVVRNPEKRFTTNNLAITHFTINISKDDQPSLVRVVTKGKLAESTVDAVKKDNTVIVEGRLQNNVFKDNNGTEKKVVEIDARAVEVVGAASVQSTAEYDSSSSSDLDYNDENVDELIGEDEIPF